MHTDEELKLINRIFKLSWICIGWFEELTDDFIVKSINDIHLALKEKIQQIFKCPFGATVTGVWNTTFNTFQATSEIRV